MAHIQERSASNEDPTAALDPKDFARLTKELDDFGFVTVRNLVPRADAEFAAQRVVEIMKKQPQANEADQHLSNILDLLDPSDYPVFAKMIAHPLCLKVAEHVLGEGVQLAELGARWKKPGAAAGPMHVGAPLARFEKWGLPVPNNSFVLAFSWMLNNLSADMGATALLPCSHRASGYPGPESGREYAIPVAAPAGSVVLYHQALWHGFAANTSKTNARVGFMGGYCGSWVDPVGVGYHLMQKRVYDRMPPAVQALNKRTASD